MKKTIEHESMVKISGGLHLSRSLGLADQLADLLVTHPPENIAGKNLAVADLYFDQIAPCA